MGVAQLDAAVAELCQLLVGLVGEHGSLPHGLCALRVLVGGVGVAQDGVVGLEDGGGVQRRAPQLNVVVPGPEGAAGGGD